ncbi:hypothetical protein [Hydrogenibacillus sp. N12]|uniref:hypothetical protein n=1 Tax=Hydrogenibacillus sp. N12 TaxID=2866627 RepID=UPI001C7D4D1A|nr:hypothetical protein [Hydrogenibacillus sp. N12]QZA33854.1 hypothetical protein K2M58_04920 [Hydrogenibacillus sp. N12]
MHEPRWQGDDDATSGGETMAMEEHRRAEGDGVEAGEEALRAQAALTLLSLRRHWTLNRLQLLYGDLALGETARLGRRLHAMAEELRREQRLIHLGDPILAYRCLMAGADGWVVFGYAVPEGARLPAGFEPSVRAAVFAGWDTLRRLTREAAEAAGPNRFPLLIVLAIDRRGAIGHFGYAAFERMSELPPLVGWVRGFPKQMREALAALLPSFRPEAATEGEVREVFLEFSRGTAAEDLYGAPPLGGWAVGVPGETGVVFPAGAPAAPSGPVIVGSGVWLIGGKGDVRR